MRQPMDLEERNRAPIVKKAEGAENEHLNQLQGKVTFLTKLYAYVWFLHAPPPLTILLLKKRLLERHENHHMIRWDPAGEYIIVERPEQLALHVLPSIYRQSRFASFSRELKVKFLF